MDFGIVSILADEQIEQKTKQTNKNKQASAMPMK